MRLHITNDWVYENNGCDCFHIDFNELFPCGMIYEPSYHNDIYRAEMAVNLYGDFAIDIDFIFRKFRLTDRFDRFYYLDGEQYIIPIYYEDGFRK